MEHPVQQIVEESPERSVHMRTLAAGVAMFVYEECAAIEAGALMHMAVVGHRRARIRSFLR
jgi:hypothetical protein